MSSCRYFDRQLALHLPPFQNQAARRNCVTALKTTQNAPNERPDANTLPVVSNIRANQMAAQNKRLPKSNSDTLPDKNYLMLNRQKDPSSTSAQLHSAKRYTQIRYDTDSERSGSSAVHFGAIANARFWTHGVATGPYAAGFWAAAAPISMAHACHRQILCIYDTREISSLRVVGKAESKIKPSSGHLKLSNPPHSFSNQS